ncbi:MAG: NAD(P)H-hydrate dehydratase [Deltaproteobacteria bacterium]|nr:NAD(P)H-hydrate dehydratase [Deltaproteobacteria bacterium]
MIPFYTREQMRAVDRAAITEVGIPGVVLMENAGRGAAEIIAQMRPRRVAIVCGGGNNGGDGLVVARHLAIRGIERDVLLVADRARISGDAKLNLDAYERAGGSVIDAPAGLGPHREILARADLIVDALFGTGLDRPVAGVHAETIRTMENEPAPKVALDLPSGLDSNTGQLLGPALHAACTVTFAGLKRGLLVHPGAELAGSVRVVSIGAPPSVLNTVGHDGELLDEGDVGAALPRRQPTAHKGTAGHLLVVAGSTGHTGAALLCGDAAMRAGAGLVTIATGAPAREALDHKVVEVMTAELSRAGLEELAQNKAAVAIGPGWDLDEAAQGMLAAVLGLDLPTVADASALTLLARDSTSLRGRGRPVILTPHPGEMSRLAGVAVGSVQADRIGIARETAKRLGAIVVLKGARTVIAEPSGRLAIAPFDNPGLGSGGTGDVLTGIIGALLAAGMGEAEAARIGVMLHGLAGDRAREQHGERGMIARDVIAALPGVMVRPG